MCKYFGTPFKWLFCHFKEVLYDEGTWEQVLPNFYESYYDMATVYKLVFCWELARDFEGHPAEIDVTCLRTILSRIGSILNLIGANNKDYGNIPNYYVFRAFLSESGKWGMEGGLYVSFETLVLSGRITNMDERPNDY